MGRLSPVRFRARFGPALGIALLLSLCMLAPPAFAGPLHPKAYGPLRPKAYGELDCNGQSTIQSSVHPSALCTDIRGFSNEDNANNWNSRFYDNNEYIGHDEPDMTFLSNRPGSGDNVTWVERIPQDPSAAPTATDPGHDVAHWFELTPAPWFSMAMCDPNSYPQSPCTPESDSNRPTCVGTQTTDCYPGGGSAFMEMQLYPPGFPPFDDAISCDDSHWCAALTIDSLECTEGYADCNSACEEPVNFAFIQRNGVPAGPPNPQEADLQTFTPDSQTLLLNPGDVIAVHMFDASLPGGGSAFEVYIRDLTTRQSGYMIASAANGFANTSLANCTGTPFNFQPEYATASQGNYVPWAALQTNISTEFETGHWEPCTTVTQPGEYPVSPTMNDTYYNVCNGVYEDQGVSESSEPSDAFCYPAGDTHGSLNSQPDEMTGCLDDLFQNGDLDFDGSPYWPEWPVGYQPTAKLPGSFVQTLPFSGNAGYSSYFTQTDVALSESSCSGTTTAGCTVPPPGPGNFYPYWSRVAVQGPIRCVIEFGNVSQGQGVNDLGGDAQYGSDQIATLGYPEFEGPVQPNVCPPGASGGSSARRAAVSPASVGLARGR
jgi:hypothetical protein